MNRIIRKNYYRIRFTLASPLAVGSGEGTISDKDIVRDAKGVPYIPASSLAGVQMDVIKDEDGELIREIFGKPVSDKHDMGNSNVLFYDACMVNDRYHTNVRDNVKLDEYKTAVDGAKFDMEILEPGVSFVTYIEENIREGQKPNALVEKILDAWMSEERIHIGAKSMRGFGAICDVRIEKASFDLDEEGVDKWLDFDMYDSKYQEVYKCKGNIEAAKKLEIGLKLLGGISVRRYTTEVGEADYKHLTVHGKTEIPVIPGSTWAGAITHRMKQLVPDCDSDSVFFGKVSDNKGIRSKVRFGESQIRGAEKKGLTRNAIDRFSGGTVDGALYTEETYYGGETSLVITFEQEPSDKIAMALAAAIADLHEGLLAVGGLTAVGRGIFEVISINGETEIGSGADVYDAIRKVLA